MNTTSLNTNAPLTAMIASHIAVGNSQSPKPAKAPARPREVASPHLRHRREVPTHPLAPKDLLCRHLSLSPVAQTYITGRTSNQSQIQRDYRKSNESLGLRLDHLVNSGFNGTKYVAADLDTKLQGLAAALVNRKANLSDGVCFRPCKGKGGFAGSELRQKRDLVERVNDFNDYYDRNLDSQALSLLPSTNGTVGKSGTLSKSRERQRIIDQLEKINQAREEIKLASPPRINNRSHHCRQLEEHALPQNLRALVATRGLPWTTQVAYQSLHHDMEACSAILKALSENGNHSAADANNLNALQVMVGKLAGALNIREKFLTNGEYFQPCTLRGGQPVWATDQQQRENMLDLVYQFAGVLDQLTEQYGSALGLDYTSSLDAFWDRQPKKCPGPWKEGRQVLSLISQIRKLDRQVVEHAKGFEGNSPVRLSFESTTTVVPTIINAPTESTRDAAIPTLPVTSRTPLPETTVIAKRTVETAHDVAVLYLKEMASAPIYDIDTLQDRIVHQVDSLIRNNSFHKEGFGTVDKHGWFDIPSTDWDSALEEATWNELTPIVQAKNNGSLNMVNYDYIIAVWGDRERVIGESAIAIPYKVDIDIDGTTYTDKLRIEKFLKPYDLNNHCFYKIQLHWHELGYPQLCYTNPVGENLKEFEGVLFHEFLHTKGLDYHSGAYFCDNVLLGQCKNDDYNMFDVLSSARFYGNSVNAHDKYRLNWLTDDDIVSLSSNPGSREVVLHHLNSDGAGKKAVKIDYQAFAGFDIWLEFRQPTELDYGLYNEVFNKVTRGLLIYKDNKLLDATPETRAIDNVQRNDVSITGHFNFEPLGLEINILEVDPSSQTIRFNIDLTGPKPTRSRPVIISTSPRCDMPWCCPVFRRGSLTTRYQAKLNDIGYGDQFNKSWLYELTRLPAGVSWIATEVKRQYPSNPHRTYDDPSTEITFFADASVTSKVYRYTMRFIHPDDRSLYRDLNQYIMVI